LKKLNAKQRDAFIKLVNKSTQEKRALQNRIKSLQLSNKKISKERETLKLQLGKVSESNSNLKWILGLITVAGFFFAGGM